MLDFLVSKNTLDFIDDRRWISLMLDFSILEKNESELYIKADFSDVTGDLSNVTKISVDKMEINSLNDLPIFIGGSQYELPIGRTREALLHTIECQEFNPDRRLYESFHFKMYFPVGIRLSVPGTSYTSYSSTGDVWKAVEEGILKNGWLFNKIEKQDRKGEDLIFTLSPISVRLTT